MRAITIVSFGGVEGLEIREVPDAPPATLDRVRVRNPGQLRGWPFRDGG